MAAILSLATFGNCQEGAFVPPIGAQMPYYFTCTNSRAFGQAFVYPRPSGQTTPALFDRAELWAEQGAFVSLLLAEWERGGQDGPYSEVNLGAMFDSSFFESSYGGSWITIRLKAWDNYGRTYEASNSALAKNFAVCYNHASFWWIPGSQGASVAAELLSGSGYANTGPNYGEWTAAETVQNMRFPVFYVNSHGDAATIESSISTDESPDLVFAQSNGEEASVEAARNLWAGTGLPPFNTAAVGYPEVGSNPAINLTFLETCNGGDHGYFSTFLIPHMNFYSVPFVENQAVHAYSVFTMAGDSEDMVGLLLKVLLDGFSIQEASDAMMESDTIYCHGGDGNWRLMSEEADTVINGDEYTKLKSVYHPEYHAPIGVSRQL